MKLKKRIQKKMLIKKILSIEIFILLMGMVSLVGAQVNNFNLEVEIAETHKTIHDGDHIWFTTKILNLGNENRKDITLEYEAISEEGVIVARKTETVAIETQASFVGSLKVPEKTSSGRYFLEVYLVSNGLEEAKGSSSFNVEEEQEKPRKEIVVVLVSLAVLITIIILVVKSKKLVERHKIKSKIRQIVKRKLSKKGV